MPIRSTLPLAALVVLGLHACGEKAEAPRPSAPHLDMSKLQKPSVKPVDLADEKHPLLQGSIKVTPPGMPPAETVPAEGQAQPGSFQAGVVAPSVDVSVQAPAVSVGRVPVLVPKGAAEAEAAAQSAPVPVNPLPVQPGLPGQVR